MGSLQDQASQEECPWAHCGSDPCESPKCCWQGDTWSDSLFPLNCTLEQTRGYFYKMFLTNLLKYIYISAIRSICHISWWSAKDCGEVHGESLLYQHDPGPHQHSQCRCLVTCDCRAKEGGQLSKLPISYYCSLSIRPMTQHVFNNNAIINVEKGYFSLSPGEVKVEHLSILVVVDFTKVGTLTTASLNKLCTLMAKVINRNPQSSFG